MEQSTQSVFQVTFRLDWAVGRAEDRRACGCEEGRSDDVMLNPDLSPGPGGHLSNAPVTVPTDLGAGLTAITV